MEKRRVCIVTCYKDPDYVRARTLRAALQLDDDNEVIIIKNRHKNVLRYAEVSWAILATRLRRNPDVYIMTFRGYELLPVFILLTVGRKRVYDEFINPVEWLVYEHKKISAESGAARLIYSCYKFLLKRCSLILEDTDAHARYSAELMNLPESKFAAVPVSTDESVFKPTSDPEKVPNFRVFYYGNMRPLHGLQYVIEAAVELRGHSDIRFYLVGGDEDVRRRIEQAQLAGAHIQYEPWTEFEALPIVAAESSLCLGGPFGGTLQASMVITGKTYQFLATAVPTLIGKTKVTTEFVDGQNCLMVEQASADALVEKILWAYEHQATLSKIGQAGYETYQQHYSVRAISGLTKKLLDDLVPLS